MYLFQAFANIKLIQLEAYHKAKTEEDKEAVELNPKVIFHSAVENCKPLLITQGVRRGGVLYQVRSDIVVIQRSVLFPLCPISVGMVVLSSAMSVYRCVSTFLNDFLLTQYLF